MITVGVDIGTYSIKIAEVEPTSKSFVIRRVQEFPLSLDLTKDRKIDIIDTLRTLFSTYDLNNTHFVFSVPQKFVSARLLTFPFRERFKVQKTVASQLEDELPFSQEDAIFDVKIVRYHAKTSEVLALAVPKERISDVIDMAHDCGVQPQIVSAESLALGNCFEAWLQPPPEGLPFEQEIPSARSAELVINIGHSTTQVLVYHDGLLMAVRNVDWGGRNISDAIGTKYGLNYLQAMKELQSKGFLLLDRTQGTKEQLAFSQVIEACVMTFVGDLRLKLYELQSEMNLQWTKASLTGGVSDLKNLGAFLTQHFQIPFNRYKLFDNQPSSFEASGHLEMVSPIAVGLAIEGLRRPRNPATNFMKDEFAQQSRVFEALWEKWGYAAQLAGVAFVMFFIFAMIRESLTATLVERSDEALKVQAEHVAGIKRANAARIRKFINDAKAIEKERTNAEKVVRLNSALDVFDRISQALPAREQIFLEIKRVQIDNDHADVHGYVNSTSERDQVFRALQKVSLDNQTNPIEIKIPVPPGKIGFAVRVKVNRFTGG